MSKRAFVVIDASMLAEIRKDKHFGERLARAIEESDSPRDNRHVIGEEGNVLATVVGHQFGARTTQIAVFEDGVAWFACGEWYPPWSTLDFQRATRLLFGDTGK